MSRSNHPVDSVRNMVFLSWRCCQRNGEYMCPPKRKGINCSLWFNAKNNTQMNNNRKKLDEPSWFEVAYSIKVNHPVDSVRIMVFLRWWSCQLLCEYKCHTTHKKVIPSNKVMLRGEYLASVPFCWDFNILRLLDKFVSKKKIF